MVKPVTFWLELLFVGQSINMNELTQQMDTKRTRRSFEMNILSAAMLAFNSPVTIF